VRPSASLPGRSGLHLEQGGHRHPEYYGDVEETLEENSAPPPLQVDEDVAGEAALQGESLLGQAGLQAELADPGADVLAVAGPLGSHGGVDRLAVGGHAAMPHLQREEVCPTSSTWLVTRGSPPFGAATRPAAVLGAGHLRHAVLGGLAREAAQLVPKVPPGYLAPPDVADFARLHLPALRRLSHRGLLSPQSRLLPVDAVVARVSREVFWHGPSVTWRVSDGKDAVESTTQSAIRGVRRLLADSVDDVPHRVAVRWDDADVVPLGVAHTVSSLPDEPVVVLPIREWIEAAARRWPQHGAAHPRSPGEESAPDARSTAPQRPSALELNLGRSLHAELGRLAAAEGVDLETMARDIIAAAVRTGSNSR
jgi:hypothetical protein